jgi:hypothetical protein
VTEANRRRGPGTREKVQEELILKVTHMYMKAMQEISLYSYPYLI